MAITARAKNTTIYQHDMDIIDSATGEVVKTTRETVSKTTTEPDYIKIYYECMLTFCGADNIPVSFLTAISKYITWSNTLENGESVPMKIMLAKPQKTEVSQMIGVSIPQIDRYIKQCVDKGVLFRTEFRAQYEVNPFLIAKGKWDSIKRLQASYDYINGKWERTAIIATPQEDTENE